MLDSQPEIELEGTIYNVTFRGHMLLILSIFLLLLYSLFNIFSQPQYNVLYPKNA